MAGINVATLGPRWYLTSCVFVGLEVLLNLFHSILALARGYLSHGGLPRSFWGIGIPPLRVLIGHRCLLTLGTGSGLCSLIFPNRKATLMGGDSVQCSQLGPSCPGGWAFLPPLAITVPTGLRVIS